MERAKFSERNTTQERANIRDGNVNEEAEKRERTVEKERAKKADGINHRERAAPGKPSEPIASVTVWQ